MIVKLEQIRTLRPDDWITLTAFFEALSDTDRAFFHPHPFDATTAKIICGSGRDVFVAGFEDGRIEAYGMLRGWADGYEVPRLGLATRPEARGCGWAEAMMTYLHRVAAEKGATRVELKVNSDNTAAQRLYRRFDYKFDAHSGSAGELIGRRELECA